jgi:hypothetical protein
MELVDGANTLINVGVIDTIVYVALDGTFHFASIDTPLLQPFHIYYHDVADVQQALDGLTGTEVVIPADAISKTIYGHYVCPGYIVIRKAVPVFLGITLGTGFDLASLVGPGGTVHFEAVGTTGNVKVLTDVFGDGMLQVYKKASLSVGDIDVPAGVGYSEGGLYKYQVTHPDGSVTGNRVAVYLLNADDTLNLYVMQVAMGAGNTFNFGMANPGAATKIKFMLYHTVFVGTSNLTFKNSSAATIDIILDGVKTTLVAGATSAGLPVHGDSSSLLYIVGANATYTLARKNAGGGTISSQVQNKNVEYGIGSSFGVDHYDIS